MKNNRPPKPHRSGWVKIPASLAFDLPHEWVATYARIAYHDRGDGCYASLETLGAGNISPRQVRRHIQELARLGYIRVQPRAGSTSLTFIVAPEFAESLVDSTPEMKRTPGRTQGATHPSHKRPPKQIAKQIDPESTTAKACLVVALNSCPNATVDGKLGARTVDHGLPKHLLQLTRLRKGFSTATLRRLIDQYGPELVETAVAELEQVYPDDRNVHAGFGALLTKSLKEGVWKHPRSEAEAIRVTQDSLIAASTPPADARFAVHRDGGSAIPILSIEQDKVRTATGVIPRHLWLHFTWLTEAPSSEVPGPPVAQEHPSKHQMRADTIEAMLTSPIPAVRRLGTQFAAKQGVSVDSPRQSV